MSKILWMGNTLDNSKTPYAAGIFNFQFILSKSRGAILESIEWSHCTCSALTTSRACAHYLILIKTLSTNCLTILPLLCTEMWGNRVSTKCESGSWKEKFWQLNLNSIWVALPRYDQELFCPSSAHSECVETQHTEMKHRIVHTLSTHNHTWKVSLTLHILMFPNWNP